MKKGIIRKILIVVLWIIGVSAISFTLGFVNEKENLVAGKSLTVYVDSAFGEDPGFLDEDDIQYYLEERQDTVIGRKMKQFDLFNIEKSLNAHACIENAEVSLSIDGNMTIRIKQRKPIIRIYNVRNESFYLDENGKGMPLSENYAARVFVINGNIPESLHHLNGQSISEIEKDSVLKNAFRSDDCFHLANFINKDSILNKLITQAWINKEGEFLLYPAVGNQIIYLGTAENLDEKFSKLKTFYKEGMNKVNGWHKYSTINLKFKDQVICTKK